MKLRKLVALLCVAVIFSLHVPVANASPENAILNSDEVVLETGEILSLRTSTSKTFVGDAEGEYRCVIYPDNVHYVDDTGKYAEISNKLVTSSKMVNGALYKYSNESNSFSVHFSDQGSEYPTILEYKGKTLAMGLIDSTDKNMTINSKQQNKILSELLTPEATAVYPDVYPGIDLMYQVVSSGVKEYIVLKQATEQNEFYFKIKCTGLKPINTDKGVAFADENGQAVFDIGQLFAIDSNEAYTDNVSCQAIGQDGETLLKLTVDKQYLLDKSRQFPVIIDPSTMVTGGDKTQDTFISERYLRTNYYLNTYLRTGRDSDYYTRWTYLNFTFPTSIPSGGITRAVLNLEKYSGATPGIRAYRVDDIPWKSNELTWENNREGTGTEASPVATNYKGQWWQMNVTTVVRKMIAGTYPKNGFLVRDLTESGTSQWTTFYSSDAPSPHKPELVIYYVNYIGSRAYQSVSNLININCMGYAIEYNQVLDRVALGITETQLLNKTKADLLNLVYEKSRITMDDIIGASNYTKLTNFDDNISSGWFRVALRIGFADSNGNGRLDSNETFDYHWWYQTNSYNGVWADKPGSLSSRTQVDSNGRDPETLTWGGSPVFYDSDCIYFAVKDLRNYGW